MHTKHGNRELSPSIAIQTLLDGNKRFVTGYRSVEPMIAHLKMAGLAASGQKPFAVVLTCSDSRSPAEIIFDQGVGDLFVVRVAGNVVAPSLLASIEFAVANFGSATILVLGHTQCGAIAAGVTHTENPAKALPSVHLEELIGRIRPSIDKMKCEHDIKSKDFIYHATCENIRHSMNLIVEQSKIVRTLIDANKLSVEGAILDISSGEVKLIT